MTWKVEILTLFPEIFPGALNFSVTGRALKNKLCEINATDIRDFASDKYQTVDDYPYGGGIGMVTKPDVLGRAIEAKFLTNKAPIVYLSPRGKVFKQQDAHELAQGEGLNLICGRFEGIDERVILEYNVQEFSLGDYVLTSGDVAAFPFLDCCIRLLPGVIEDEEALLEESFAIAGDYKGLLEYPHYTRPAVWKDHSVPDVLLSGDHAKIKKWRLEQAKLKTATVRPDLLKGTSAGS
jgi:tRNA (guanine37-N1)-methyltransferase